MLLLLVLIPVDVVLPTAQSLGLEGTFYIVRALIAIARPAEHPLAWAHCFDQGCAANGRTDLRHSIRAILLMHRDRMLQLELR